MSYVTAVSSSNIQIVFVLNRILGLKNDKNTFMADIKSLIMTARRANVIAMNDTQMILFIILGVPDTNDKESAFLILINGW